MSQICGKLKNPEYISQASSGRQFLAHSSSSGC
jgi:hypothetical protein